MPKTKDQRLHVIFKGRVQGVGFRFTAEELALQCGAKGWVKNLPNGDVEMLAEGPKEILEQLVKDIRATRLGQGVTQTRKSWEPSQQEFEDFTIEYVY